MLICIFKYASPPWIKCNHCIWSGSSLYCFLLVFKRLGTKLSFSMASHPQTDGHTERMNNGIVEDVLRVFVNHEQNKWNKLLPLCEFSVNNSQASTGNSPFFLNYGLNPSAPADNVTLFGSDLAGSSAWLQDRSDAAIKISQDALIQRTSASSICC